MDPPIEITLRGHAALLRFVTHARQSMTRRGVSEAEVIACLRQPDVRGLPVDEPEPSCNRKRWGRYDETGRRRLDVVFEEAADGTLHLVTVITVYRKSGEGI